MLTDLNPLVEKIDALLPQTQCGQCGYAGCMPYAVAIAESHADINQCPPGGDEGIRQLAAFLGVATKPLNPENGIYKPKASALIDEPTCIGCTLCIQACPVDAIVGASKHMHTVIAAECTGCELCIAPCPVDCISMIPLGEPSSLQNKKAADLARKRYQFRLERLDRERQERMERLAQKSGATKALITKNSRAYP